MNVCLFLCNFFFFFILSFSMRCWILNFSAERQIRIGEERHAYAYCNLNGLGRPVFFFPSSNTTALMPFLYDSSLYLSHKLNNAIAQHMCCVSDVGLHLMYRRPKPTTFFSRSLPHSLDSNRRVYVVLLSFIFLHSLRSTLPWKKKFFSIAHELVVCLRYPVFFLVVLFIAPFFSLYSHRIWLSTFLASNCWETFWFL